ncbi:unnamed protein product [Mycena citricolor]|uniref:Uncharacterized protein n=1 Tax=Mycena citricolor TaxID=2018698 RepID=A0AAD2K1Q7_9AGAR|nr:unnamed protein product [Mycena citricolor]
MMDGPKAAKKRKLTDKSVPHAILQNPTFAQDSQMYQDLLAMERKLDWTMTRKKAEIQDALVRTPNVQPSMTSLNGTDCTTHSARGPCLHLFQLPGQRAKDKISARKFSTFIKRLVIELDRDPNLYPEGNIVEWPRAAGAQNIPQDGFTIRRKGDVPTKVRVIIYLEHQPEQLRVIPELANILGIKEDSRIGITQSLWNYIKVQGLQDKEDRRLVRADDKLRHIFGGDSLPFQKLSELANRCLTAPEPVVLNYVINPTVSPPERPMAWDVEVKMEDVGLKSRMSVVVQATKESSQSLAKLDDEISTLAQSLQNSHLKRTFLESFANDPSQFIQTWLESQSRDLETVLGSGPSDGLTIRQEELKRSEFFKLPWVEEAVSIQEGLRLASKPVSQPLLITICRGHGLEYEYLQNLLRTLTESKTRDGFPEHDLKLLLTSVKDIRRQAPDTRLQDAFYDSLEGLLLDLRTTTIDNHDAEAFLRPVTRSEVPDYHEIISHPMDLQTMLKKVKLKQYKSKRDFQDDLDLIWANCLTYNAKPTHHLRQCAKRLKVKADRLLRNITDRRERQDPLIPAALGGGGPMPGVTRAMNTVGKAMTINGNGNAVNGHRPTTITIKPHRRSTNDIRKTISPGTSIKRGPAVVMAAFGEMPALVRTTEGMRMFSEAESSKAVLGNLQRFLPVSLTDDAIIVKEEEEDIYMDRAAGEKRPWTGSDNRPRKRLRQDSHAPEDVGDPFLWWSAAQSDALIPNGLPHIPYPSSGISARPPTVLARKRRPKKVATSKSEKFLLTLMNDNIRTIRRLRHTHTRFSALGLGQPSANPDDFDAPPAPPPLDGPAAADMSIQDEDAFISVGEVDDQPWGAALGLTGRWKRRRVELEAGTMEEPIEIGQQNAENCMQWMTGKVLEHAGFQGSSRMALDVLASVTSEYMLNVGRTLRYLSDKYGQTMTPEEIILHTLFESGISRVQDLERYISDDIERYGSRLGDLEKKIENVYREVTAVGGVLDDEALFEDDDEEAGALAIGDFADALGEDYLGLRELGIAAEFNMSSLSIPKKLLRSKRQAMGLHDPAGTSAPKAPLLPYPPPPAFVPLTLGQVESQIGLLQAYYMNRFQMLAPQPPPAATGEPIVPPPIQLHANMQLADDLPLPASTKMGPLGQITLSKANPKKKGTATQPGSAAKNGETGADSKKKKKGATGVGTGNGRKKNALMLPPPLPVPTPIIAAGV